MCETERMVISMKRIAILLTFFILLLSACEEKEMLSVKSATPESSAPTTWDTAPSSPTPSATPPSPNDLGAPGQFVTPPNLSSTSTSAEMFAPVGWLLMDYVETDYNGDGNIDIIGVLENENAEINYSLPGWDDASKYPRILFAAINTGVGYYKLDFQDVNLVRTRYEGGTFGDPYEPLTAEGNTFTINAFGGSSWKWDESSTFKYMNGEWYLVYDENRGTHGPMPVSYIYNNYESGVGFRGYNDTSIYVSWPEVVSEENYGYYYYGDEYDLSFNVSISPPVSLYVASQRSYLAVDRLGEIIPERKSVANMDILPDDVPDIGWQYASYVVYMDENYILYRFTTGTESSPYLAAYDRHERTVTVVAQTTDYISLDDAQMYNGMVYYTDAANLVRVNPDGSGRQTIFEYDSNLLAGNHLYMMFEGVRDGLLIYIINGSEPDRYYFINPDNLDPDSANAVRYLGEIRGTPPEWLGDLQLVGRIGDDLNIHMNLNISQGHVTGSYYYDRVGQAINLRGTFSYGNLELYEEGDIPFEF